MTNNVKEEVFNFFIKSSVKLQTAAKQVSKRRRKKC